MKTYNNFSPDCHQPTDQTAFDFRWVTVAPVTKGGQHIRNRFGVRPDLADLIAFHAGLGSAADR
jgi:hypothetical protein